MVASNEKKRKRKEQKTSEVVETQNGSTEKVDKLKKKRKTERPPDTTAASQLSLDSDKQERKEARAEKRRRKEARAERRRLEEDKKARREAEVASSASATGDVIRKKKQAIDAAGVRPGADQDAPSRTATSFATSQGIEATTTLERPSQPSKKSKKHGKDRRPNAAVAPSQSSSHTQIDQETLPAVPSALPQNARASSSTAGLGSSTGKRSKPTKEERQRQLASMSGDEFLATVWLSTGEMKEMAETAGLTYKEGLYTTTEKMQIKNFLERYRVVRNLTEQQLVDIINATGTSARRQFSGFWKDVAMSVPGRPLKSVHSHVKRAYLPASKKGKWTKDEDDELRAAYMEHGPQWNKVGERVDRAGVDCKDRWRNHVAHSERRRHGRWTKEEAEQLRQYVLEMAIISGLTLEETERDVPWQTISTKMGNTRGPSQCRIKWTDDMLPSIISQRKAKWNASDSVELYKRLIAMNFRDRSEIKWHTLPSGDWNAKSGHVCQIQFHTQLKAMPELKDMPLQDLLPVLLTEARKREKEEAERLNERTRTALEQAKSTSAPTLAGALALQSRYKSKAIIDDSDPDATDDEA